MGKTIFNWFSDDWKRVKNHCRTTDNKNFSENEASETFQEKAAYFRTYANPTFGIRLVVE